jgi:hypothetical protein
MEQQLFLRLIPSYDRTVSRGRGITQKFTDEVWYIDHWRDLPRLVSLVLDSNYDTVPLTEVTDRSPARAARRMPCSVNDGVTTPLLNDGSRLMIEGPEDLISAAEIPALPVGPVSVPVFSIFS